MKKKIRFILFFIASIPKTVYFNFRTLRLIDAVRLPIIVGYNVKITETHKNIIAFSEFVKPKLGMIRFGWGGPKGVISNKRGEICLERGKVVFEGSASFGEGCSLRVNGELQIGDSFSASKNTFISCGCIGSTIGNNVMLGWNVSLRDSDGHTVYKTGVPKLSKKPFHIGNHVWICAEAHVLKGVTIGDDSIVAYRSTVTKSFPIEKALIGGSPAALLDEEVTWGPYVM